MESVTTSPIAVAGLRPNWISAARGARSAPMMMEAVEILVDGNPARLIDLSPIGAQVLSGSVLKPNQRVRVSMVDERVTLRMQATVAWARFEMPKGRPDADVSRWTGVRRCRRGRHRWNTWSAPQAGTGLAGASQPGNREPATGNRLRDSQSSKSVLRIVSSRSEPVETMAAGTPLTSSSRAM